MSETAAKTLEAIVMDHSIPLSVLPDEFEINLARLNSTGEVSMLAGNATCGPVRHQTALSTSALDEFRSRVADLAPIMSRIVVHFWLDDTGQIKALWIQEASGDYLLDRLALDVVRALRYEPAIVGGQAVPALVAQEFGLR